jgi:hypothetical protein
LPHLKLHSKLLPMNICVMAMSRETAQFGAR